ncbi:hypothetical protein J2Z69_001018 [Paenibacillus shirakamiensis]|uniref:Uncharacterized protein n=1 Tax=Paenibacillus shirakamiensis TaxID=1265935 RepID=A0ABS4JE55_9BACL|nr:hypothetical protein [Paenibacillus shirakamiensis]
MKKILIIMLLASTVSFTVTNLSNAVSKAVTYNHGING